MEDRIGLVLSGGGARGAYEMGALSVMLPILEERSERPTIITGTSVGAINAAYVAGSAHLSTEDQASGGIERWEEMTPHRVVHPVLTRQVPLTALKYVGEVLDIPGVQLPSLLDPAPLRQNLRRWLSFSRLRRNVDDGLLDAVCLIATVARSGRTVGFCDTRRGRRPRHRSHAVHYVPTRLEAQHVRASAAIPIIFPAVWVERPAQARGWYYDGGTRLNTPIKPALDLGAKRLVVIGMESLAPYTDPEDAARIERPDFGDGALNVLQGLLADPVMEDMRNLANINTFLADETKAPAAVRYRKARGKPPYTTISYIFISPSTPGAIGEIALDVFKHRYGGLKALRSPDVPLLSRLLGGDSATHGELLSYLMFDPDFARELIELGQHDAKRWIRRHTVKGKLELWCTDPMHDLVAGITT